MLNRTAANPVSWPIRWPTWQRSQHAEALLVRYLLVVLAICALGCIYYWQASELRALQKEIIRVEQQVYLLERENIRLAEQAARWNSPAYVEKRMREEGYTPVQLTVRVRLSPDNALQPEGQAGHELARWPLAP